MSGAVIHQHHAVIRDRHGLRSYEAALARLTPEHREELTGTLVIGWVAISTQEALYDALSDELGRSVEELHSEVARLSSERNFKTLWRMLLRLTSDAALVSRAPLLYRRTYSKGKLIAEQVAPGHIRLALVDWPGVPEFSLRGLRIGIETVLRLAGRREPHVTSDRTPEGAVLQARYRA